MEDREIWEKTLGFFPEAKGELGHLLDRSAVSHCLLNKNLL
jgi:spore photoproduct lyase